MARDDDPPPAKRPRADCTGTSSIDGDPPPAKRTRTDCPSSTSIHFLPADLLREIFVRLNSLSDLVRAACTSREWRTAVVSSPPFRRRFIKGHRAPLLGLFFDPPCPDVPAIPSFAPARGNDPVLVAALLHGEFLLTNLQTRPLAVEPSWVVLDARGGYLLLMNWAEGAEGLLALLNPLVRTRPRFFDVDDIRIFDDHHTGDRQILRAGIIFHDENPDRFGIFCLASQGELRLRAAIFSSDEGIHGTWVLSPWLAIPPQPHPNPEIHGGPWAWWLDSSMRLGNFICWPYRNRQYVVVLDSTDPDTPVLFVEMILFPAAVNGFGSYIIGETRGGRMSIAYTDGFNIDLVVRAEDGRDAGTWTRVKQFNLFQELNRMLEGFPQDHHQLELVAMRGSIVYFTTSEMHHPTEDSCRFGSLCLETGEKHWLFARAYDALFQPYHHLSWTSFRAVTTEE